MLIANEERRLQGHIQDGLSFSIWRGRAVEAHHCKSKWLQLRHLRAATVVLNLLACQASSSPGCITLNMGHGAAEALQVCHSRAECAGIPEPKLP